MTDEPSTTLVETAEHAATATAVPESDVPSSPASIQELPATPEPEPEVAALTPSEHAPQEVPASEPTVPVSEPEAPVAEKSLEASPAPVPAAPTPAPRSRVEDQMLFEQALANMEADETGAQGAGTGSLTRGERIEAKVIQVEKDRVFVDLGTKAEGVVPLSELSETNLDTAVGHVQPGDTFEVIVLRTNSAEGNPIVSKKKADFDQTWLKVIEAFETGKVMDAPVVERVKGGLVVDVGVRGFVPATHVGNGKLRNIDKFVGEVLQVKIIELDRDRRKVVLSNKVAEGERKEEFKEKIFTSVKPQDVLEGKVRRLADYGAFVDLGGIDGLLHISEMSWARIDHPREVLTEGQTIKVMVLRLDPANGRVSLGLRQVLPDPWNLVRENYKLGEKIKCQVTRMVPSGVFVRLPEGAEAFLPLSEISDKKLRVPEDELEANQEIEPMIIDLRPEDRRMVLSLRPDAKPGTDYGPRHGSMGQGRMGAPMSGGGGSRPGFSSRPPRRREGDFDQSQSSTRTPSGGATIGERLGALRGFLKNETEPEAEEPSS